MFCQNEIVMVAHIDKDSGYFAIATHNAMIASNFRFGLLLTVKHPPNCPSSHILNSVKKDSKRPFALCCKIGYMERKQKSSIMGIIKPNIVTAISKLV